MVIPNPLEFPVAKANPIVPPEKIAGMNKRVIIAAGRLVEQKRHDRLVEAFFRLARQHPDWDLVILGEGPERSALEAQIRTAGISGRVHLPGFVGNPGDWYQRADIYVMTSSYEGFPNTLLEAMASGLPSIAFDIKTGPREIMDGGRLGILLPDDDHVHRLEAALERLILGTEERTAMGRRAKEVRETFAMDNVLAMWDRVLHKAVGKEK